MPVPDELMELLRCVECHSPLRHGDAILLCTGCGLRYPVEGDVPVMLAEAAYREETT